MQVDCGYPWIDTLPQPSYGSVSQYGGDCVSFAHDTAEPVPSKYNGVGHMLIDGHLAFQFDSFQFIGFATPDSSSGNQPTVAPGSTTDRPCAAGDVTLNLTAATREDDVQLVLDASGKATCRLSAQANLFLMTLASIPSGSGVPDIRNTLALDRQFPFSGTLATWDWSNWCWDTTLPFQWRLNVNDAQGNLIGNGATIDVDTFPPCQDAKAASTLSLETAADFTHDVATITGNNVVGP